MTLRTTCLRRTVTAAALLVATAGAALAGPIFKVVGPDGKVTYTDHPPAGAVAPNAASGAGAATSNGGTRVQAMAADNGTDTSAAVNASSLVRPDQKELFIALVFAESFRETLQQADAVCVTGAATPNKNFRAATLAWKTRNQAAYQQVDRTMGSALQAEQRQFLVQQVSRLVDKELDKVRAASIPARMQWCDLSAQQLAQGKMDIDRIPGLRKVLLGDAGH